MHHDDEQLFITALNKVLKAQLDTEQLRTIYALKDDPTLTSVKAALAAIGLKLTIQQRK